jgi:ParB/RepB/Spo0J family partition protein
MNGFLQEIPIEDFELSLSALRFCNPDHASDIELQMWINGQLQPLVVRAVDNGRFQIIDGHKRYYAALEMNLKKLQCYVLQVNLQQAKVLMLSYNRYGRSLEAWEEALILIDLEKAHGLSQAELAKVTGYSRSWVCRRLSLLSRLCEQLVTDLKMGIISSSHARALIKLPRGNQLAVADIIIPMKLTYHQCNTLIDALCKAKDQAAYQHILDHPEEVVIDTPHERPYEDVNLELSDLGNDLENLICDTAIFINNVLEYLQPEHISRLKDSEKVIITKDCMYLCEGAQKLIQTITEHPNIKL